MRKAFFVVTVVILFAATNTPAQNSTAKSSQPLATLVQNYFEAELQYNPTYATFIGDTRYHDLLYIEFTQSPAAANFIE